MSSIVAVLEEDAHSTSVYENTNGMPMANGKNLHMDCGHGDLSNRIITVGSLSRAEKIAACFDSAVETRTITSSRGFTTISGTFEGTPVSVVSIGMGPSMMDFFVRESRAVIEGPMVVVRFGTCGGIAPDALPGKIVVSTGGSGYINRNPDYFMHERAGTCIVEPQPYTFFELCPADAKLSAGLQRELISALGDTILTGVNVTAESFYSSQGRIDDKFDDDNDDVIASISSRYPNAKTLEMETFMLLHLAKCCKVPIYASACAIVVANRCSASVVDGHTLDRLEVEGGKAILRTICAFEL